MAEPIEMPFGAWTRVDPRNHVLDGGARWRNLANTIEPSVCGGDAALRQITLTTCCIVSLASELAPGPLVRPAGSGTCLPCGPCSCRFLPVVYWTYRVV